MYVAVIIYGAIMVVKFKLWQKGFPFVCGCVVVAWHKRINNLKIIQFVTCKVGYYALLPQVICFFLFLLNYSVIAFYKLLYQSFSIVPTALRTTHG